MSFSVSEDRRRRCLGNVPPEWLSHRARALRCPERPIRSGSYASRPAVWSCLAPLQDRLLSTGQVSGCKTPEQPGSWFTGIHGYSRIFTGIHGYSGVRREISFCRFQPTAQRDYLRKCADEDPRRPQCDVGHMLLSGTAGCREPDPESVPVQPPLSACTRCLGGEPVGGTDATVRCSRTGGVVIRMTPVGALVDPVVDACQSVKVSRDAERGEDR